MSKYPNRGRPLTLEHRQNISMALQGNKNKLGTHHSEATKEKLRKSRIGFKHTEETKAIIKEKRKLQVFTPETRAKMSASRTGSRNPNYGKSLPEHQKRFLSEINKGENNPHFGTHLSDETKEKIRIANSRENHYNFGGTLTEDHKQKISAGITGEKNPNWIGGATEYCHKFRSGTFRHRVRAFWGNNCQLCGKPVRENETLDVHHVYYNKKACCDISPDGKYYSDLGFKGQPKTFEIIGDPNKFVPLHHECHTITTAKKNREYFARKFEKQINDERGGRSFFTPEEYKQIVRGS